MNKFALPVAPRDEPFHSVDDDDCARLRTTIPMSIARGNSVQRSLRQAGYKFVGNTARRAADAASRPRTFAPDHLIHSPLPIASLKRMRSIRGRRVPLLIAAALLPLSLAAAETPDTTERALRLDQTIQGLKDEVIELTREAQDIESIALVPDYQRVSVYLRVGVRGLLLSEVSISIDDKTIDVYHYDEKDSRALLADNSLQRLLRTTVTPGPHRIRIEVVGKYADDKEGAAPTKAQFEAIFDKDEREAELEFAITRASRFGEELRIGLKQWRRQS